LGHDSPSDLSVRELVHAWADGQEPHGVAQRALSAGLRAASGLWWLGTVCRSATFRSGLRRRRRVDCPVVSVGNLTVGGTGKTPVVIEVARFFWRTGRRVAVVSRGYARKAERVPLVVSRGEGDLLVGPREAGDEPAMIARALPQVAVVVGARRHDACRLARSECGADVIVLDDGFQHQALARDCDLVLWDALRPADHMALLPRGLMREGLGALRRAHGLIFTRCNLGGPTEPVLARVKRAAPHLVVFFSDLLAGDLRPFGAPGDRAPAETLRGRRVAAVCGLGNPRSFWRLLESLGADLVLRHAFPDHYRPTRRELDSLVAKASDAGAQQVIVTEKDLENLPNEWAPGIPALALPVRVSLGEDARRFEAFLRRHTGL